MEYCCMFTLQATVSDPDSGQTAGTLWRRPFTRPRRPWRARTRDRKVSADSGWLLRSMVRLETEAEITCRSQGGMRSHRGAGSTGHSAVRIALQGRNWSSAADNIVPRTISPPRGQQ
ncbi:hypothetical protein PoB_007085800 [Plakobranchus ocellatus]|uniref:Uncharacterized protein n=1 Tax=Plakobranchus ocellatus TaxID=259542 RepID=A0AAV4DJD9_9GAST|nr:hypothetical protein PoB_007085800 [Plakobranchus ocellatus]